MTVGREAAASICLERSQPCLISLHITPSLPKRQVIPTITAHFGRLLSLSIWAGSFLEAMVYSDAFSGIDAPYLETFSAIVRSSHDLPSMDNALEMDAVVPFLSATTTANLRSLTVKSLPFPSSMNHTWEKLTFLNVKGWSPTCDEFAMVIGHAPQLETLYLPCFDPPMHIDRNPHTVAAPTIKTLCVGYGVGHGLRSDPLNTQPCECVLFHLRLEGLERLVIVGNKVFPQASLAHRLGSAGMSKLKEMRIANISLSLQDDIDLFRNISGSLGRLELWKVDGALGSLLAELKNLKEIDYLSPASDDLAWIPAGVLTRLSRVLYGALETRMGQYEVVDEDYWKPHFLLDNVEPMNEGFASDWDDDDGFDDDYNDNYDYDSEYDIDHWQHEDDFDPFDSYNDIVDEDGYDYQW